MAGNLTTRLERLEAAVDTISTPIKLVRMCFSDDEIAAVHREASERGLSDDEVHIIHIVPLKPLSGVDVRLAAQSHEEWLEELGR